MAGTDPILGPSGAGIVDASGKLTDAHRAAFAAQVGILMTGGNLEGKGPKISSILGVPFPPTPAGIKLLDVDRLLVGKDPLGDLFWFDPSPLAPLLIPGLSDPDKDYQKIIIDNLYAPLVKMLNLNGSYNLVPIFDPTSFFPHLRIPDLPAFLLAFPTLSIPTLPAFAIKFNIDLPSLKALFLQFIPPPIPSFSLPALPPIPSLPNINLPFIKFPDLFIGLLTIPIKILLPNFIISLIIPSPDGIPPDIPKIFLKLLTIALDLLLPLLQAAILPKLIVATFIIILQNMVSMLVCDVIGMLLGTGGLVQLAATVLGLV